MTTSRGYQGEEWKPLDVAGRTWETAIPASMSNLSTPTRPVQDRHRSQQDISDDLAVEAGYSRPGRLTPQPEPVVQHTDERVIDHPTRGPTRHSPPVIKEQHVWGVADEWGGKAGKWGKGSKAFKQEDEDGSKSGDDEKK
jgi:protein AFG1